MCARARVACVAAWSKRRGSVMYSHLRTPDHMLKRRAEVAAKKASLKREISPVSFCGLRTQNDTFMMHTRPTCACGVHDLLEKT